MAKDRVEKVEKKTPLAIVKVGTEFIIPANTSYKEAAEWCVRMHEKDEEEIAVLANISAFPYDGALAFTRALKKLFGWASLVPTPGFFGKQPPTMVDVRTGLEESVQVPWGRIELPTMTGYLETSIGRERGMPCFCIRGKTQRKYQEVFDAVVKMTGEFVRNESIYKNKMVKIAFPNKEKEEEFDLSLHTPQFIDLRGVNPEHLVLPEDVARDVEDGLFTPIRHPMVCRRFGVPPKRGVLLAGRPGVGKTMIVNIAGQLALTAGWTGILIESAKDLRNAILFAKAYGYSRVMIATEDIDRVDPDSERNDALNEILNVMDGIDTKGSEIMVIVTTNRVDRMDETMLRPGRLDLVVTVREPDAAAVVKLIQNYGHGMLKEGEDLSAVGVILAGQFPSVVREVVERAKLSAIRRLGDVYSLQLKADDLERAAKSMSGHLLLLKPKPDDRRSDLEKGFGLLADAILKTGLAPAMMLPEFDPTREPVGQ